MYSDRALFRIRRSCEIFKGPQRGKILILYANRSINNLRTLNISKDVRETRTPRRRCKKLLRGTFIRLNVRLVLHEYRLYAVQRGIYEEHTDTHRHNIISRLEPTKWQHIRFQNRRQRFRKHLQSSTWRVHHNFIHNLLPYNPSGSTKQPNLRSKTSSREKHEQRAANATRSAIFQCRKSGQLINKFLAVSIGGIAGGCRRR